jgi:hypothetical protein
MTLVSFSSLGRGNWPEFLRSKVKLERRPGVKLAKGFLDGPGTAALEAVFPEPKGRKLRRARREGNDVPPEDAEGWVMADWGGGPLPEGVLFGGTRPRCGTDNELGRELLGGGLRVAFGEKRGI